MPAIEQGLLRSVFLLQTIPVLVTALIVFLVFLFVLALVIWFATYHPARVQAEEVICTGTAPKLKRGQRLKIMTWNVQFMAGKNHTFFFDVPGFTGPDERPTREEITQTLSEVARTIHDENPDLVLLQEVDNGATRTDYEDQLARLLTLLPADYICRTTAYYWKAAYIPHPRIHGAVGMRLVILSKFKIANATRHQLALPPADPVTQAFGLKRAVLETRLPVAQGSDFVVMTTHLDAFAQGSNTMQLQIQEVDALLTDLTDAGHGWVIGGDFNLLPDQAAYQRLPSRQRGYYNPQTEIVPLLTNYQSVPSLKEVASSDYAHWFTHFSNDPKVTSPDRTIDYLFMSKNVQIGAHHVRSKDTQHISDHLPVIAEIQIP